MAAAVVAATMSTMGRNRRPPLHRWADWPFTPRLLAPPDECTLETLTVGGVTLRHELTADGHDAGPDAEPDTIRRPLVHHHGIAVSRSTVARHLVRAGLVGAEADVGRLRPFLGSGCGQPG